MNIPPLVYIKNCIACCDSAANFNIILKTYSLWNIYKGENVCLAQNAIYLQKMYILF